MTVRTPEGPHQCRHARRCRHGAQVRRRRHRPVPHRAHVLRGRPHHRGAPDDPGRRRGRAQSRAGQAAADAARRFRSHLQGDGGPAGHHPPARSAAARIPAAQGRGDRGSGRAPPAPMPRKLRARAIALHEANPMLGHRGCRLGITYPEIYEMQARAILEAALACGRSGRQAGAAGNHDPAGGLQGRTGHAGGAHRRRGRGDQDRNAARCRTI